MVPRRLLGRRQGCSAPRGRAAAARWSRWFLADYRAVITRGRGSFRRLLGLELLFCARGVERDHGVYGAAGRAGRAFGADAPY